MDDCMHMQSTSLGKSNINTSTPKVGGCNQVAFQQNNQWDGPVPALIRSLVAAVKFRFAYAPG